MWGKKKPAIEPIQVMFFPQADITPYELAVIAQKDALHSHFTVEPLHYADVMRSLGTAARHFSIMEDSLCQK